MFGFEERQEIALAEICFFDSPRTYPILPPATAAAALFESMYFFAKYLLLCQPRVKQCK